MPKKKTIEEVREFIKENSNGECELLSETYVNDRTPLLLKCKCGNIFERKFCKIKRGRFRCDNCKRENLSELYRKPIDDVIKQIEDYGCEYVSGEYKNSQTKLTLKCKCGNVFQKSLNGLWKGQNRCPDCGKRSLIEYKTKYRESDAISILSERGYTMIGEYKNSYTPVLCRCKEGHETYIRLDWFRNGQSGCEICHRKANRGENSWNYKGGISKVSEALRHTVYSWKSKIADSYDNKCPITGETENLTVHHLTSFVAMFRSVCEDLGLENHYGGKINDYSDPNIFYAELDELYKRHTPTAGILLSKKVHTLFHKQYGKNGHNTPEQFDEFLRKNYNITLEDVMQKQKTFS